MFASEIEQRVAQEICRVDRRDPYEMVQFINEHGASHSANPLVPQWHNYLRAARMFLAGLRALGTM